MTALRNPRVRWGLLCAAAVVWALWKAGLLRGEELVNPGGWVLVVDAFSAALAPELGGEFLSLVLDASMVTLAFATCGTALALVLGVAGGVLGSEVWWETVMPGRSEGRGLGIGGRAPWVAVRGALALPRAIHEIIWGLLFIAVLGLDPLVGILAIGIPFGAITAKVFSEILDETPRRSLSSLRNAGVPPLGAFLYGLVPRAFPDLLSYAFYRFECAIRSAAVLGIIGAGGLGYQIFLSLQSLRWDEMWTFLFALVVLTGLTDLWSSLLRGRLGSSHRVELGTERHPEATEGGLRRARLPAAEEAVADAGATGTVPATGSREAGHGTKSPSPQRRTDWMVRGSFLAWGLLLVLSFWHVDAGWAKLTAGRTGGLVMELLAEGLPPGLGGLTLVDFVDLSARTLAMSILAMVVAGVGGLVLSFPAAHNFLLPGGILNPSARGRLHGIAGTAVFGLVRLFLLFLRAVPAPIWALLLLFVLFPGILPGAIALGLYTLGVLGRLMAETTENLDARPLRALRAQGATGAAVFLYSVLPATMARNTAYLLYRWEVSIRATAMVGVVGAGGLGQLLQEQLSSFDYAAVATTLIFYVVLTFLVDMLSAVVRRDLR